LICDFSFPQGKVIDAENQLKSTRKELENAISASDNAELELKRSEKNKETVAGPSKPKPGKPVSNNDTLTVELAM
jgi:hypothetical protein